MLEVRELHAFYGQATALRGVDLDVADGEIVCVVGSNGAGKSTLVNAIAGIHRSLRGTISMHGTEVSGIGSHRVCDTGIAVVPEGRRIFPRMSVRENLDLGAYRKGARATRGERLAWVHELFPRLAERAGQAAGSLSGGEQQMLAIGRALMARPKLMLMDEPSLGLAPAVVDTVFAALATIRERGVTVLLVEQRARRTVAFCDRTHVLANGRLRTTLVPADADDTRVLVAAYLA
jgi:branched-chain amino acid transport system ATP-binding protein